jgi:hypothetical protein
LKVGRAELHSLFSIVYHKKLLKEKVDELFDLLDEEQKGYIV